MTNLSNRAGLCRKQITLGVMACIIAVELALGGAELGLWGTGLWRMQAFALFSFQPLLWEGAQAHGSNALWTGQPVAMLITHIFVHVGFLHMLGNILPLALLMRLLGWMRPRVFLGVGLVAACTGALTFWAFAPAGNSMIGASGAVSGLAAFWITWRLRQNPVRWKATAAGLILLGALTMVEVLPGVSTAWQTHLGGALAGAALSVWYKRPAPRTAVVTRT